MFQWAAGDFDHQGIRLSGSGMELYRQTWLPQINAVPLCITCARVRALTRLDCQGVSGVYEK